MFFNTVIFTVLQTDLNKSNLVFYNNKNQLMTIISANDILKNNSKIRIFKTKLFHQWSKKIGLDDKELYKAATEIVCGSYEAKLGGYLYKKRIKYGNKGKSGSLRTIIAFKYIDKAFFIYGFKKNYQDNLTKNELIQFKQMANKFFSHDDQQLQNLILNKIIFEVNYGSKST